MAQKLYVKVIGPDGKATLKEVNVIRAWQESDGRQIYLHTNGVYGYKDGAPVKGSDEFSIIGDPTQHKMAMMWWNKVGKDMSGGYYARVAAEIEKRQMIGIPDVVAGDSSDLDAAMYMRRPIKDKRRKAFSEPSTWPELEFTQRPDWWGYAGVIELGIYRYEKVEVEEEPKPEEEEAENVTYPAEDAEPEPDKEDAGKETF